MNDMQAIAAYLNNSTTGCIATVGKCSVSVQVPGLQSLANGKTARCYSTETVRTMQAAIRLVMSME